MELEVKILIKEKELLYLQRIFFIKGRGRKVGGINFGDGLLYWRGVEEKEGGSVVKRERVYTGIAC